MRYPVAVALRCSNGRFWGFRRSRGETDSRFVGKVYIFVMKVEFVFGLQSFRLFGAERAVNNALRG